MTTQYHPIGTWVEVARVAGAGVLNYTAAPNVRQVYERELKVPLIGQVVGVTRLYAGERREGSYEDPAYLQVGYGVQVYLVKLAMRGEPIRALPAALTILAPDGRTLPFQRRWDAPGTRGDPSKAPIIVPNPKAIKVPAREGGQR